MTPSPGPHLQLDMYTKIDQGSMLWLPKTRNHAGISLVSPTGRVAMRCSLKWRLLWLDLLHWFHVLHGPHLGLLANGVLWMTPSPDPHMQFDRYTSKIYQGSMQLDMYTTEIYAITSSKDFPSWPTLVEFPHGHIWLQWFHFFHGRHLSIDPMSRYGFAHAWVPD